MKTNSLFYFVLFLLPVTGCGPQTEPPALTQYRTMVEQLQQDMVDKHLTYNSLQLRLQDLPILGEAPLRTPDGAGLPVEDLVRSGPVLIFRYSEVHCNSCTDLVIQKMNKRCGTGAPPMAIIASYREFRHFTGFVRANQLQMPIYLLDPEEATGIFDTEIPPYLFVLDASNRIRYPFVPIKEIADGIDMYLDFVTEQFADAIVPISRSAETDLQDHQ